VLLGLLTDAEGEPLAVRVSAGNTADPMTIIERIKILQEQFDVRECIFVGGRVMVKGRGTRPLNLRYITAPIDLQFRGPLGQKILQLELFSEQRPKADSVRYFSHI